MPKIQPTSVQIKPDKAEAVMRKAIACATTVHADELDCQKSFIRQDTAKTPEEVLQLALTTPDTHWNFIYRTLPKPYYDVGCCVAYGRVEYFLWLSVPITKGRQIIREFGLSARTPL